MDGTLQIQSVSGLRKGKKMFDIFGNFDTAEELNACAKGLLEEGDLEHLRELAKENGIPDGIRDGFERGIQGELTDPVNAAIGKLDVETVDMGETGMPTRDIVSYLSMQCFEDEHLARQIRRKKKSLKECIQRIRKEAEDRVKERKGQQVVNIPDLEVFQMAADYYREA